MNKTIEHYKELLNLLPRNNVKNSRIYMKKAKIMRQTAIEFKRELVQDIKKRYTSVVITKENEEIDKLKTSLGDIKSNLYLLNKYNDSYEKSSLDEVLYDLKKYYNNDLIKVNNDIKKCLEIFREAGINLTYKDFNYGLEVNAYMDIFFKENNPESSLLKEEFDKLYWKCPDLINYINLNFRGLYFANKKKFESFYDNKLKELNITNKDEYLSNYKNKLSNYLLISSSDIKILQDKFIKGDLDIKEYEDSKINKLKESLTIKEIDEKEQRENILKLSYTLYEYKNYLKYRSLIEAVKTIYQDKNNKNLTKSILGNISKQEKSISKANKKLNRKFFGGKKEKNYETINNSLKELLPLYNEYDEAKFKESIANSLTDNSTILDLLYLVYGYKINLRKLLKADNEEIEKDELDKLVNSLEEFIYYPNNTIINNITINDTRDVVEMILDKYKLMNVNVTKEQLEETNLDSIISTVNKVIISNYINNSNLKFVDINNICEMKKILEKENIEI